MSRLREVLDRILGIEPGTEHEALQEFEESGGTPLPDDHVEGIVRRCVAAPTSTKSRWWRRPAAIIPLAVLLVAAAVPIVMNWSGRRSTKTLPYEQAIETVFDRSRGIETRLAALGRIHGSLQLAFAAIKERAGPESRTGQQAFEALGAIALELDQPAVGAAPLALPYHGTFADLTNRLASSKLTEAEGGATIASLERYALMGIRAMKRAANEGPRFERNVEILLRYQRKAVQR